MKRLSAAVLSARRRDRGTRSLSRRRCCLRPSPCSSASISDMQKALAEHRVTSRELVLQYLVRIGTYEDKLNAAITVNPKALEEADALDRERAAEQDPRRRSTASRSRSRTTSTPPNMPTTGRRARLRRSRPALRSDADEEPARRGRDHHRQDGHDRAGELRRGRAYADADELQRAPRATASTPTTRGAIRARRTFDGRPALATGGSSSGVGTAASFWAANVGTRDDRDRSSARRTRTCSAGIKPTVGPDQPLRRHPDHRRPGHRRADGEDRHRRRHRAGRARKARRPTPTIRPPRPARRRPAATTRSS